MPISFTAWLGKLVRTGSLEVETADGAKHVFGDGSGPLLGARLADRALPSFELLMDPAFAFVANSTWTAA